MQSAGLTLSAANHSYAAAALVNQRIIITGELISGSAKEPLKVLQVKKEDNKIIVSLSDTK